MQPSKKRALEWNGGGSMHTVARDRLRRATYTTHRGRGRRSLVWNGTHNRFVIALHCEGMVPVTGAPENVI